MTNKALEKVNSVLAEPSLYSMTTTKEGFLGFYFLEISTLQVLKFLPHLMRNLLLRMLLNQA